MERRHFLCDLLRVICTNLLRCSSGCCHSILSAKQTGRCCGEGNGFCWKNWLHWCILRSASPLELPSPPSSMAGRVSWEPASSICCRGPGNAGEIQLLCQWEPTSPCQAVQTYLHLKEAAHCYQSREILTGISCLFSAHRLLTMVVTAGHAVKWKRKKQLPEPCFFMDVKGTKKPKSPWNGANWIPISQK